MLPSEASLPLGGRCPAGAEGESFARNQSFGTTQGSLPHPLRGSPLAEGAAGSICPHKNRYYNYYRYYKYYDYYMYYYY